MTLTLPAYRSTRSRWQRLKEAFFTAYVNLHLRRAERIDRHHLDQIETLD